jgi:hypothetical protein
VQLRYLALAEQDLALVGGDARSVVGHS